MDELKLYNRVVEDLKKRRERVLSGNINCIPLPFERFRAELPGIEQSRYYLFTANSKVGKTQICDAIMLYSPFFYAFHNRDKIRIKIFYFTLEMSAEEKYRQFICHILFVLSKGKIRIDTKKLRSTDKDNPLPEYIFDLIASPEYIEYFKFFEENVVFIDDIRHPTGIFTFLKDYAKRKGTQYHKKIDFKDNQGNILETKEVDDYYVQDDPEEYRMAIVDHYKLFQTEKENGVGLNLMQTIGKWSSDYAIKLRNKYGYIIAGVQQQMPGQESNENAKLGKLKPTLDGLSENKSTQQDANVILGLFSPFRHAIQNYEGYDVLKFKDNIRFLEILGGREGGGGMVAPLFFDGAVNYFKELPLPHEKQKIEQVYKRLQTIRGFGGDEEREMSLTIINKQNKINLWQKFVAYLACQARGKQRQQS